MKINVIYIQQLFVQYRNYSYVAQKIADKEEVKANKDNDFAVKISLLIVGVLILLVIINILIYYFVKKKKK